MNNDYTITTQIYHANIKHIFTDSFDITFLNDDPRRHFTILPIEESLGVKDDGLVNYYYNKQGFRCDDFIEKHNGLHVVFGGCSDTEGVGGNIEDVWTHRLYSKLKEDNEVSGFFSLAKAGFGWEKIIHNFRVYVKKYGFPDYYIVLLPNVGRFYEWDTDKRFWTYQQKYTDLNMSKDQIINVKTYMEKMIHFVNAWNLFEDFCISNNVKLIFSTWNDQDSINFKKMNLSQNFFEITRTELQDYIIKQRPNGKLEKNDLKFRDGHSGKLTNKFRFTKFLEQVRKRNG